MNIFVTTEMAPAKPTCTHNFNGQSIAMTRTSYILHTFNCNLTKVRPPFIRHRKENLIIPHYRSCSVLIILTNQSLYFYATECRLNDFVIRLNDFVIFRNTALRLKYAT